MNMPQLAQRLRDFLASHRLAPPRTSSTVVRLTPWIALAMVEDAPADVFPFPECERLTAARLRQIVRNHNPQVYRPPVYTGADRDNTNTGSSHWWGMYMDPLGFVELLEFDGLTLWGRLSELVVDGVARIEDAVARGRFVRSIGFHYSDPAMEGGVQLMHLALAGGEEPGQKGLPPLVQHLPGIVVAEATDDAGRLAIHELTQRLGAGAARLADLPVAVRFFNVGPVAEASATQEEEHMPLSQNEIDAIVAGVRAAVAPDITAAVAPVQASVATLQGELAGVRTSVANVQETAAATRTATETAASTAAQAAADQAAAGVRLAVQQLVDSCRLAPALVDATVAAVLALPEAGRTSYLAALRQAPPILPAAARTSVVVIGADGTQADAMRSLPPEMAREFLADGAFDPAGVRLAAAAIGNVGGLEGLRENPTGFLAEALRLNGGTFPWGSTH